MEHFFRHKHIFLNFIKSHIIDHYKNCITTITFHTHRYLVIVCNPGHVLSQSREKDFEKKRKYQKDVEETKGRNPFIMVLDSLGK